MIVPMRWLALVIPASDRKAALDCLHDMGVMQVSVGSRPVTEEENALSARLAGLDRALNFLRNAKKVSRTSAIPETAGGIAARVLKIEAECQRLKQELSSVAGKRNCFAAWGNFDPELLKRFEKTGLYVYLCEASLREMKLLAVRYTVAEVGKKGSLRCFAVLSGIAIKPEALPLAPIPPGESLADLVRKSAEIQARLDALAQEAGMLKSALPVLESYRTELEDKLEFQQVWASVAEKGVLASVTGFVPETRVDEIRDAARRRGWGFAHRAADPSKEDVPTLLKNARPVKLITPLMDFLGIAPGYGERDVNLPFLFFFTIFFGMLVGDAGYGALFLVCSAAGWMTAGRKRKEARLPLALLMLLSLSAVVWGWMSGNCFGMIIPGLPWLATDGNADQHTELVCFGLALTQLALAHLLRMTEGNWRNILGQAGWILVLSGNFGLVYWLLIASGSVPGWFMPAVIGMYFTGIVLAAAAEIHIRDVGTIFSFPFSIISSFVDILSYIRLFAVGMSGLYLARCFNSLAGQFVQESLWLVPVAVLVLLVGHLLNISLAVLGVLVHGVRLNMLEFSSHLGLRWSGTLFAPFGKRKN